MNAHSLYPPSPIVRSISCCPFYTLRSFVVSSIRLIRRGPGFPSALLFLSPISGWIVSWCCFSSLLSWVRSPLFALKKGKRGMYEYKEGRLYTFPNFSLVSIELEFVKPPVRCILCDPRTDTNDLGEMTGLSVVDHQGIRNCGPSAGHDHRPESH